MTPSLDGSSLILKQTIKLHTLNDLQFIQNLMANPVQIMIDPKEKVLVHKSMLALKFNLLIFQKCFNNFLAAKYF